MWRKGIKEFGISADEFDNRGEQMAYNGWFMFLLSWYDVREDGINVREYFDANHFYNIAVYGAGEIGRRVINDFLKCGVRITCCIDRMLLDTYCGVPCILPGQAQKEVLDVIVVTPVDFYDEIEKSLMDSGVSCPVISVDEIYVELCGRKKHDFAFCQDLSTVLLPEEERFIEVLEQDEVSEEFLLANKYGVMLNMQNKISPERYGRMAEKIFSKNIERLKEKRIIRVAFVVYMDSTWSCDKLYWMLEADDHFEPYILVVPAYGEKKKYDRAADYYCSRGYKVLRYEECRNNDFGNVYSGRWADVMIRVNTYGESGAPKADISNCSLSTLHAVVPYTFWLDQETDVLLEGMNCGCVWKFFCPSLIHKKMGIEKCVIGNINMDYTGYPKMDYFINHVDADKVSGDGRKTIIYAPGGAVKGVSTTFMQNSRKILEIAKKYSACKWIYRAHPILGDVLAQFKQIRCLEEYDEYVNEWRKLPNACVSETADYYDIFMESSAMITDSISFVSGYQYTGKPLLILKALGAEYNEYGRMIMETQYQCMGDDYNSIEKFIEDVVIGGNDSGKVQRDVFFENNLNYFKANRMTACEKIYYILKENFT